MRKTLFILALVVPIVALGHGGEDDHQTPRPLAARPASGEALLYFPKEAQFLVGLRTMPVRRRSIQPHVDVPGKVIPRPGRYAQVYAPVAGRLVARPGGLPLVGQRVRRGEVLATVSQSLGANTTAELADRRIQAETRVSETRASLEQARRDLERQRALGGVVARKEVQRAELAVNLAEQEHARALRQQGLYAAGASSGRLTATPLLAPIDGVILEAHVADGEQVDPGRPLLAVLDPAVVWIEASVFAPELGSVEAARDALIRVDAYPDQSFPATLVTASRTVDETTRTVKFLFEAPNPAGKLRPGQFAEVGIATGASEPTLAIPDAAVVVEEGQEIVYLHVSPEGFVARPVRLGARDGLQRGVLSGLEEGDRVVIAGTYQLRSLRGVP
jgi:cobalt-zinc-cadmium efflux system membrane fusion protein